MNYWRMGWIVLIMSLTVAHGALARGVLSGDPTITTINFSEDYGGLDFFVGESETPHVLLITGGGYLYNVVNGWIGYLCGANNNTVTVTGSESRWDNEGDLYVGNSGAGNGLIITNGGTVNNTSGWIGNDTTASNNTALVASSNSVWNNSGDLTIGAANAAQILAQDPLNMISGIFGLNMNSPAAVEGNNRLTVLGGGQVSNNNGFVGACPAVYGNSASVTGNGALWRNAGDLYIGSASASNRLTIAGGGQVEAGSGVIGSGDLKALNNAVLVSGPGSAWLNSGDVHVGSSLSFAGSLQQLTLLSSALDDPAGWNASDVVAGANSLTITGGGHVLDCNGSIGEDSRIGYNAALVAGSDSIWNNSGDLAVGGAGRGNLLTITDRGRVVNVNGTIGAGSTAISNAVVVSGPGSCWLNAGDLHICALAAVQNVLQLQQANSGIKNSQPNRLSSGRRITELVNAGNSLTVADGGVMAVCGQVLQGDESEGLPVGGRMTGGNSFIGDDPAMGGNSVLVTGSGSVWSNAGDVVVGNKGPGNRLTVRDGAGAIDARCSVGYSISASNNTVQVSGGGSIWSNRLYLVFGVCGSGNQLTIDGGGRVVCGRTTIGAVGGCNDVQVTGTGSQLDSTSLLTVGLFGAFNQLLIAEGGMVTAYDADVGCSRGMLAIQLGPDAGDVTNFFASADNNEVLVAGGGALWSVGNMLRVGISGSGNVLTIAEGGTVAVGNSVLIGCGPDAVDNQVIISGGGLTVTNAEGAASLEVLRGTFTLNGGVFTADAFVASSGSASAVDFNSGTFSVLSATVANNAPFIIGDGTRPATFQLRGGTASFADGLVVAGNAELCGAGSIAGGGVEVADNGVLASDAALGDLVFAGDLTLAGTLSVGTGSGPGSVARISVAGTLNITAGQVDFMPLNRLNGPVCVFASYGALEGGEFRSVSNLPYGYTIDYHYGPSGNEIALVWSAAAAAQAVEMPTVISFF